MPIESRGMSRGTGGRTVDVADKDREVFAGIPHATDAVRSRLRARSAAGLRPAAGARTGRTGIAEHRTFHEHLSQEPRPMTRVLPQSRAANLCSATKIRDKNSHD